MKLTCLLLASALAPAAHADIFWTGAVSDDVFDEGNWDLSASSVTTIEPNVSIGDNVIVRDAPQALRIPDLAGQQRFQIDDGFTMTLDNSTITAANNDGIGCFDAPPTGITINVINGAKLQPFFVVNSVHVVADPTAVVTFGGGGNPVNLSTVEITGGSQLNFLLETPASFASEHLSKVTVDGAPAQIGVNIDVQPDGNTGCFISVISPSVGVNYCGTVANSAGPGGTMSGEGSDVASASGLTLRASALPPNQFGIFLASRNEGFVQMPGGNSNGNLCLGGTIGRFNRSGEILSSGAAGTFALTPDLSAIPQASVTVAAMAGETWYFQAWFRDGVGLGSNFTDGLRVDFN